MKGQEFMDLTKRRMQALEKLFIADMEGSGPVQSKARVYDELETMNLAEKCQRVFGSGRFSVIVKGWKITLIGHFTYCEWADENCEDEDEI